MNTDMLTKQVREGSAILKLNRLKQANALNRDLFVRLTQELDKLQRDKDVRVLIITGEGEKAFCAGIDLKERAEKEKDEILFERENIIRPFYDRLGDFPKPTIAALNGFALGGGAEMALACDIRIATPAARFGQTEIKWGMIPSCGACQRLRLVTSVSIAKDIIFTGRVLEAEEAFRLGIYNRLVSGEQLMEEVMNLSKQISANPPIAIKQAKKVLDMGVDIRAALDFDFEASKECFFSGDTLTRVKTF